MLSNVSKEYLKTIYVLKKQNNEIRVTDIANKMNCSKPNVTKQLNILSENGLINYEAYGKIEITNEGEKIAIDVLANYDIVYIWLNDVIGMNSVLAKKEATNIKNVISKEALDFISNDVNKKLGLNKLKCSFDVRNEKCRNCIMKNKEVLK